MTKKKKDSKIIPMTYTEASLYFQKENIKLLKEILKELKKRSV